MCFPLWSVAFPFKKSHLSTGTILRSNEVAFTRFRQCNIFLEEATCCNIYLQHTVGYLGNKCSIQRKWMKMVLFSNMLNHEDAFFYWRIQSNRQNKSLNNYSQDAVFLHEICVPFQCVSSKGDLFISICRIGLEETVFESKHFISSVNSYVLTFQKANTCTHFWKHNIRWREQYVMFTKNLPEQNKSHDSTIAFK